MEIWKAKTPWVYFAECVGHDIVKIGATANGVRERFVNLQQSCPFDLSCIGAYAANHSEERALHKHFAAHRIRGEWFTLVPEIRDFVNAKCPNFDLSEVDTIALVPEVRDRLLAYLKHGQKKDYEERRRRRLALTAVIRKHKMRSHVFDLWIDGKRYPSMRMLRVVEQFFEEEEKRVRGVTLESLHALQVSA